MINKFILLILDHHHVKDIDIKRINDIKKINDIIVVIHPVITIEKKIKNVDHVLHHVTTSKFIYQQNLFILFLFSSHYSNNNNKYSVSTKDANNNIHQRSSKQTNGVSSSSHQKFNLK